MAPRGYPGAKGRYTTARYGRARAHTLICQIGFGQFVDRGYSNSPKEQSMIMKIVWLEHRGSVEWERSGWYLFGILPLYIADHGPRMRRKS